VHKLHLYANIACFFAFMIILYANTAYNIISCIIEKWKNFYLLLIS